MASSVVRRHLFAWAVCSAFGCGGEARVASPAQPIAPAATPRADATEDAGPLRASVDASAILTLDALALRAPTFAPGMHEALRHEGQDEARTRREIVRALDHDVCARVAFSAGAPVHAWLENASGASLADIERAESGILAARGPVCVRRGDTIIFRTESLTPTQVRLVAWTAP